MRPNEKQREFSSGMTGMLRAEVVHSCRFEVEVARLGLTEAEWEGSAELKAWCEANKDTYYVPTVLLTVWKMSTIYDEESKPTKLVDSAYDEEPPDYSSEENEEKCFA